MNKETLDDILRVGRRVATPSDECVKRWPVCFTKSGECFPRRFICLGLPCLQYDGPMRRLERRPSFLQSAEHGFRSYEIPRSNVSLRCKLCGWALQVSNLTSSASNIHK